MDEKVALVLISHESAERVAHMREGWLRLKGVGGCLIAYGGAREEFDKIPGEKIFIEDLRLRTHDHQREFQSYSKLLGACLAYFENREWDWLYFAEYDLVPLSENLIANLVSEANQEKADMMGPGACRLDNTLHPHYAAHAGTAGWLEWIGSISRREDRGIVLSCLGCCQLWRRRTLQAVLGAGEPMDSYMEILLPTVAHHLGFRVRPWKSHAEFILPTPLPHGNLSDFVASGADAAHPIKNHWASSPLSLRSQG